MGKRGSLNYRNKKGGRINKTLLVGKTNLLMKNSTPKAPKIYFLRKKPWEGT